MSMLSDSMLFYYLNSESQCNPELKLKQFQQEIFDFKNTKIKKGELIILPKSLISYKPFIRSGGWVNLKLLDLYTSNHNLNYTNDFKFVERYYYDPIKNPYYNLNILFNTIEFIKNCFKMKVKLRRHI